MRLRRPRGAAVPALAAAVVLGAVYLSTLAPGPTFWDACEFIAAAVSFGVPHPPGTPLYVLLSRAWLLLLAPVLSPAVALNAMSAAATAVACGVAAWLLARATGSRGAAFAAAIAAGSMATIWLNATETEVYAVSLLLVSLVLAVTWRAGAPPREPRVIRRWTLLAVYLLALAVPLHMSALVVVPAAVVMLGSAAPVTRSNAALLGAAALVPLALAAGSAGGAVVALVLLLIVIAWRPPMHWMRAASAAVLVLLALTALLVIPLRAARDPFVNAGDATSLHALWEVVSRQQYGGHTMWPRQAPAWAQIGNLAEYFDWQVALGLAPGVAPDWRRTPFTLLFALLGVYGMQWHRRADRRSWLAFVVLFASATVALVVYLNFKAGASFGYGVLPASVAHEARERDYFFAPAFWCWGLWVGMGAYALAHRIAPRAPALGALLAALPIFFNRGAVNRTRWPERVLPTATARALLGATPPRAVLFVTGDNDTFPLWYAQVVEHTRPDVSVVTIPLLGAPWYRSQLARRDTLSSGVGGQVMDEHSMISAIAASAGRLGRPVAAALTVSAFAREAAGTHWIVGGPVAVGAPGRAWTPAPAVGTAHGRDDVDIVAEGGTDVALDTLALRRYVASVGRLADREPVLGIDPAPAVAWRFVIECPRDLLIAARSGALSDSLATRCNLR